MFENRCRMNFSHLIDGSLLQLQKLMKVLPKPVISYIFSLMLFSVSNMAMCCPIMGIRISMPRQTGS
jgi:hypothetical protein